MHPGAHAEQRGDHPAIVMAGSGTTVAYRELDAGSNRLARYLHDQGLRSGDVVALLLENHPRYHEVLWAGERSGLYYTAISTRLTPGEVAYILEDSGAQVVITSRRFAGVVEEVRDQLPGVRAWLMIDGMIEGVESYEQVVDAYPAEPLAAQPKGQDLLYSSGTTGRPKGIKPPLTGRSVDEAPALAGLVQGLYGMTEDSVYLSPAPLYHSAPLRFTMAAQRLGATVVVMERFEPEQTLELIERYSVTHAQFVPTMFVRLVKLPPEVRERYDVSSLQTVIHAAAPCPIAVKEQMIEWWGPIIHEYYAGTEGNGFVAIDSHQWLEHKGSVGRPLVGEVHIVGEDGRELPAGEVGTIYFESATRFEYHNDPGKTASAYDERGWSTIGDLGWVDEDGFVYLADRRSHLILSGGVNIYPAEIESELILHPKVADVAVFGIPNDEFGEEVKAVVQPENLDEAGPALEQELIAFCRERLADFKCPRSIDFLEELPRSRTGKLYKRELQDPYWEREQAS